MKICFGATLVQPTQEKDRKVFDRVKTLTETDPALIFLMQESVTPDSEVSVDSPHQKPKLPAEATVRRNLIDDLFSRAWTNNNNVVRDSIIPHLSTFTALHRKQVLAKSLQAIETAIPISFKQPLATIRQAYASTHIDTRSLDAAALSLSKFQPKLKTLQTYLNRDPALRFALGGGLVPDVTVSLSQKSFRDLMGDHPNADLYPDEKNLYLELQAPKHKDELHKAELKAPKYKGDRVYLGPDLTKMNMRMIRAHILEQLASLVPEGQEQQAMQRINDFSKQNLTTVSDLRWGEAVAQAFPTKKELAEARIWHQSAKP